MIEVAEVQQLFGEAGVTPPPTSVATALADAVEDLAVLYRIDEHAVARAVVDAVMRVVRPPAQPVLMEEPTAKARLTDPGTSWEAARRQKKITLHQKVVLRAIREFGPMTDEELVDHLKGAISPSGARSRRKELVDAGLIRKASWSGQTKCGSPCLVWIANDTEIIEGPFVLEGGEIRPARRAP